MKTTSLFLLASTSAAAAFAPVAPMVNRPAVSAVSATELNLLGKLFKRGQEEPEAAVVEEPKVEETPEEITAAAIKEGMDEGEEDNNMMSKIKTAGKAGALSLFIWELAFWAISIPVAIFTFTSLNGAFPDFSNQEDIAKVGAEAFAFANVARLALPARIALAVATIPWVEDNIIAAEWAPDFLKESKAEE